MEVYVINKGFSESLVSLLLAGHRASTYSTYESAWRNRVNWCYRRNENPLSVPIASTVEFIAGLYGEERSYSSLNVHRSMLSNTPPIDGNPIGIHPLVKNLLNGCYNLNPPKPKYNCSWDPPVVIQFMATLGSNDHISLSFLTKKRGGIACIGVTSPRFGTCRYQFSFYPIFRKRY